MTFAIEFGKKPVQADVVDFRGCLISAVGKRMKDSFIKISLRTAYEITACFCTCNAAMKMEL